MPGEGELQQQQQHQPQEIHVNQNQDMDLQIHNDPMMMQQNAHAQNMQVQQNRQQQGNVNANLQENVHENMPQLLEGNIQAPKEQGIPLANESRDSIYSLYGTFSEIEQRDSERMRAVKAAYIKYTNETKGGGQNLLTDIDNLDNLISACRWYNATRWSLRSNARERQRQVKVILEAAKKERARIAKIEKERAKSDAAETRKKNRDKISMMREEEEKEGGLIVREHSTDLTDSMTTLGSEYWAKFKSYTFGLFGRNILNIGMGAIAGAAWLATYPLAALVGAVGSISGNQDLKKYYKGFNIKIPRPMSPKGWFEYYMHDQKHATTSVKRIGIDGGGRWRQAGEFFLRLLHYNLWHPLKHILTLDMKHLSGRGYFEPHGKANKKKLLEEAESEKQFDYTDEEADDVNDGEEE